MYFIYRGRSSKEFGLKIKNINDLSSPQRKVEIQSVPGRNGDLYTDTDSYESFKLNIECDFDPGHLINEYITLKDIARDMKRWLQSEPSLDKLFLSDDLDNYYEAICLNKLDIARVAINFAELLIIFECNPILKSIEGNAPIIINENNRSIYNKGLKSYPYFKIYGTGDVTININEQQLILKSIEEYIEVDSEIYNCFKDNINLNNKMYSDFPLFYPGTNNISWSGDISKIEIIPRWGDV